MIGPMAKQELPKNRPPLNLLDPLANSSPALRCVAALFKAGFNKSSAQRELKIAYTTIDKWEQDVNQPDKANLQAIGKLTGYSVDALLHGEVSPPETVLNREERANVLRTLKATPDEKAAFAEHEDGPDGRYADMTRTYVATFVLKYRQLRADGYERHEAIRDAYVAAVNADADAAAKATGRSSTIPAVEPPSSSQPPAPTPRQRRKA